MTREKERGTDVETREEEGEGTPTRGDEEGKEIRDVEKEREERRGSGDQGDEEE